MRASGALGYDPPHGPRPSAVRRSTVVHGTSQRSVARAGDADVHGGRPRALGGAPAADTPDLCAWLAGARSARPRRFLLPVGHQVGAAALRLRRGDARGAVDAAPGIHGPRGSPVVDGGARHPVLPPHRAPAAARTVMDRLQPWRRPGADEPGAVLGAARGAAPL